MKVSICFITNSFSREAWVKSNQKNAIQMGGEFKVHKKRNELFNSRSSLVSDFLRHPIQTAIEVLVCVKYVPVRAKRRTVSCS